MIVVVERSNTHRHRDLLEKMFRQRAQFFHDRLKWDVRVVDGQERDRYDDQSPVYIIYTDDLRPRSERQPSPSADHGPHARSRRVFRYAARRRASFGSDHLGVQPVLPR